MHLLNCVVGSHSPKECKHQTVRTVECLKLTVRKWFLHSVIIVTIHHGGEERNVTVLHKSILCQGLHARKLF